MPERFEEATPNDKLGEQVRDVGAKMVDAARERVRGSFEKQQHRAADQIAGVADALRDAADRLSAEDQGLGTAKYVRGAADKAAQFADQVRERGLDDLVGQAEGLARRQPELFVGGALLAGIALGRFLRSTSNRRRMAGDIDVAVRGGGYTTSEMDLPPEAAMGAATSPATAPTGPTGLDPRPTPPGLNPQIIP